MTRYYKYSADPSKGKYVEVTENEFITQVMSVKGRFYIPMGDVVLECSEQEYREYRKERNRHNYLQQIAKEKNVTIAELNDEILSIPTYEFSEEAMIENALFSVYKEKLPEALKRLSEDEQYLIHAYYFQGMSQSEISAEIGESQQTISYRLGVCLAKLRKFLKC